MMELPDIETGKPAMLRIREDASAEMFCSGIASPSKPGIGIARANRKIGKRSGFAPSPSPSSASPAETNSSEKQKAWAGARTLQRRTGKTLHPVE